MRRVPPLVLASTSPYRKALLARLGIPFEVLAPAWKEVRLDDPGRTASENALGKARAGARAVHGAVILASDQVAYCEGRILEKPGTVKRARTQLELLEGQEHTLHTSVAVRTPDGFERDRTVVARLRMRKLTDEKIASYIHRDMPLDCAGSYKIESLGVALFESILCDDPTAIEGLPLIATAQLLEEAGYIILPRETAS
jgi:septum formation protein